MKNFTLIVTLLLVVAITLASACQTRQLRANRNRIGNNRPVRVTARNLNRRTVQNVVTGRNRAVLRGQRVLNANRARNAIVRTGGNIIRQPVRGIPVVSRVGLVGGANFLGGARLVQGRNFVGSTNFVGGANFVSGGNLAGFGGDGLVAPSNCCLSRVVPKTVCNTLGGHCALVNRRVCLRKCVPDTVVLGK